MTIRPREHSMGQLGQRGQHQLELTSHLLPRCLAELRAQRHPGVVDQHVDPRPQLVDVFDDRGGHRGIGQVADEVLASDTVFSTQSRGQVIEPLGSAGDQDEVVSLSCEMVCERLADAGGSAGDQGRAVVRRPVSIR
ncbi:hypothetical protein ABID74_001364 [Gordonia terrae]